MDYRSFTTILLLCCMSFPAKADEATSKKVPGIVTMAAGGLISLVGFVLYVGPPSGGDPCSEDARRSGEAESECRDRVAEDRIEARKIGQVVLPVGLITTGVGFWLVQSNTDDVTIRINPKQGNIDLAWRMQF